MLNPTQAYEIAKPKKDERKARVERDILEPIWIGIATTANKHGSTSFQKSFNLMSIVREFRFNSSDDAVQYVTKLIDTTAWVKNYKIASRNAAFLVLEFFWDEANLPDTSKESSDVRAS